MRTTEDPLPHISRAGEEAPEIWRERAWRKSFPVVGSRVRPWSAASPASLSRLSTRGMPKQRKLLSQRKTPTCGRGRKLRRDRLFPHLKLATGASIRFVLSFLPGRGLWSQGAVLGPEPDRDERSDISANPYNAEDGECDKVFSRRWAGRCGDASRAAQPELCGDGRGIGAD